ncbi:MAG TPA: DinB family protein [Gemmatimonadaceae bacterium]|nr:DinB family protein [Gemmatimonadaceae bacterium]
MMNELRRLEEQLRAAVEGSAWHGPAVLELLSDVTPEQAAARPIAGAHSIWELVLHLAGTYRLVLRRVRGDGRQLSLEEDWPAVGAVSAIDWRESVAALRELNAEVRRVLSTFPADRLDEQLVSESPYTAYTQFIGLTQHDLYHAGQIALLKRAVTGRSPTSPTA